MARRPPKNPRQSGPQMSGGKPSQERRRRKTPKPDKKEAETRMMDERVKSARGRKISSTLWLKRQLNDPYVKMANMEGYRSRAANKLKALEEKFGVYKNPEQTATTLKQDILA